MNLLALLLFAAVPSRLTMDPGTQRVINLKHRCAPQSTSTAAVNVMPIGNGQILIMADGTGTADVFFACNQTRISVTVNRFDGPGRVAEVKRLLSDLPIAAAWWDPWGMHVHCPSCDASQDQRVAAVVASFPPNAEYAVKRPTAAELIKKAKPALSKFPEVKVEATKDGGAVLYGTVASKERWRDVRNAASGFSGLGTDLTIAK
ncbi:MAG: hypothetical protein ACO1OB_21100 [Archangium sp.]